jgi:hypothetical protein
VSTLLRRAFASAKIEDQQEAPVRRHLGEALGGWKDARMVWTYTHLAAIDLLDHANAIGLPRAPANSPTVPVSDGHGASRKCSSARMPCTSARLAPEPVRRSFHGDRARFGDGVRSGPLLAAHDVPRGAYALAAAPRPPYEPRPRRHHRARFHPVEIVLSMLISMAAIVVLGSPAVARTHS